MVAWWIAVVLALSLAVIPPLAVTSEASPSSSLQPATVRVERTDDGDYRYLVDEEPHYLVGMGYNVIYRNLSDEERAARYDEDFELMRALGINTIIGWDADKGYEQDKWDELTLDKAWEHGLGVLMPFYLPPEGNYADPDFRAFLKAELAAKVERYKDHPAIRMWGVGNEVIQGMVDDGQVDAFGEFYLELAGVVHEIDPNHPVIYREAEEVFFPDLTWYQAVAEDSNPWLLYGMNIYTFRLEEILANWPSLGYALPLFVTEFAPEGWSHADRPAGYVEMWRMIQAHPDFVLGGAPYVWTTEGPEPVDRDFGLVDGEGNPVDGSLEALGEEFN